MADDNSKAMTKALEVGRETLRIDPPNGVPREPFVFTDPAELEYFSKPDTKFALWRTADGLKFRFHNLTPTIIPHLGRVEFDVTTAFVTWEKVA